MNKKSIFIILFSGLFSISMALKLDKICIPNPFYQVYMGAALFRNASKVFLLAEEKNNFLIDLKKLEDNLKKAPALVYFCSPTNPQGKLASFLYLEKLIKIIRRNNSVLVVDECYIDIYYDEKPTGTIEVCEKLGGKLDNVIKNISSPDINYETQQIVLNRYSDILL